MNYKCDECRFENSQELELVKHYASAHGNDSRNDSFNGTYPCDICDFVTDNRNTLKSHRKTDHELKCDNCDFKASNKNVLRKHYFISS